MHGFILLSVAALFASQIGCSDDAGQDVSSGDTVIDSQPDGVVFVPSGDTSEPGFDTAADTAVDTAPTTEVDVALETVEPLDTQMDSAPMADEMSEPDEISEPDTVACVPDCLGRACGDDGCSGSCGTCTGGDICSLAGTCNPNPSAGCGGLELAEDWAGTVEGDANFNVLGIPLSYNFDGTLAYSISCLNSKLIVNGEMSGVAESNAFTFAITGTYNPATKMMDTVVKDGVVFVVQVLTQFNFDGWLRGTLQGDGTFSGQFDVQAVSATNGAGPLDPAHYNAWSTGTWEASPN